MNLTKKAVAVCRADQRDIQRDVSCAISKKEIELCLPQAVRKLDLIIKREGDGNGERLKPYYLAKLLCEVISLKRFSREINSASELVAQNAQKR